MSSCTCHVNISDYMRLKSMTLGDHNGIMATANITKSESSSIRTQKTSPICIHFMHIMQKMHNNLTNILLKIYKSEACFPIPTSLDNNVMTDIQGNANVYIV
jgi:hypothetical protein